MSMNLEPADKVEDETIEEPTIEETKENNNPGEEVINKSNIVINVFAGSGEELANAIATHADEFMDNDNLKDPNSTPRRLASFVHNAMNTPHTVFLNKLFDTECDFGKSESKVAGGRYGQDLRGDAARFAFTAKLKGLKKVYLYNSGFHIMCRPLSMAELHQFFTTVDIEDKELGRLIGHSRFTIQGAFLKRMIGRLLPEFVIGSNLKGWHNDKTLFKNISFADYDTIMHTLCSLMDKKPLDLNINCFEGDCDAVTSVEYDINNMLLINNNALPPEAIEFIMSDETVTPEDLERYRNEILPGKTVLTNGDLQYEITVPSFLDVVDSAVDTIKTLIKSMNGVNDYSNTELRNRTIVEDNRNYIPWINKITTGSGKQSISTRDKKIFPDLLRELGYGDENAEFHSMIADYRRNHQIAVTGYTAPKCSVCNKRHETESGYVAWDFEKLFFDRTCQALSKIGLTLGWDSTI